MARHVYSCAIRWSDMDAFGHVNNVVFLRYLEEARVDLMWRLATETDDEAFEGGSVVARHEIDYRKPLVHRHAPVTVETWVTKIGAASLTLAYEIKDEDTVYVRASTVVVPFDFEAGRPRRLTRVEEKFLSEFVEETPVRGKRKRDDQSEGAVAA